MPTIVVVGRRLGDGLVELRDRRSGERTEVPLAEIVTRVTSRYGRA
jgi:prolyl-tRNA synthetase